MGDYTLIAAPVLGGYDKSFDGTQLTELVDLAVVSVSLPMGGEDTLAKKVKSVYGCAIPAPGESHVGKDGSRLVGFTSDQFLVLFDHAPHSGVAAIEAKLKDTGYYCEQTNNWVSLVMDGPLSRAALGRQCAVNLHKDVFAVDRAQRTTMEHMGAIVIRTGEDAFLLMSASSTGGSYLHALETSLKYVG